MAVTATKASIDSRVAQDLERLRQAVRSSVPDVEALILTGSFAHGEGAFLEISEKRQPYNDYDVVVVAKTEPDTVLLKSLGVRIARETGIRGVDLIGIGLHRFAWLPPSIFNYDLRHEGYVFYGDKRLRDDLPDWEPRDIPLIEAQVLLLNRVMCLLECVQEGPEDPLGDQNPALFQAYQTAKAAFALADAKALLHGAYAVGYERKRDLLRSLAPEDGELAVLVDVAWRLRQDLHLHSLGMSPARFWRRTREALLRTFMHLLNWMYASHRPFGSPRELACFLANYGVRDRRRAGIEAAQYATLVAWEEDRPDAAMLALARSFLTRANTPCAGSTWPAVRTAVVSAWFRYCH